NAREDIRAGLDAEAVALGWPELHARLAGVDARAAAKIHPNDAQRIQRALEVVAITGEPISTLQARTRSPLAREFVSVALIPPDRARLHSALAQRFESMMAAG